jgi:C_GCAxxG_C_C family probable redox protein
MATAEPPSGEWREYRRRGTANLLRMGHCAPAVTQTLLDVGHADGDWLVRLAAGLPGGIGNTGFECGAVTAPLIALGLRFGDEMHDGLPVVVWKGHAYCRRFVACNGSLLCSDIRGDHRLPLRCVRAVRCSAELHARTVTADDEAAIPEVAAAAYRRFQATLAARPFHCAHAVLERLVDTIPVGRELLDATSGFVGGTVLRGLTCSALAAGVMAIGVASADIERSRLRVLRMIALLLVGGRALDDDVNAFNHAVNVAHELASWFKDEFGSTVCRVLTDCNLSSPADVERFAAGEGVAACEEIAPAVAQRVRAVLAREVTRPHPG